MRFTTAIAAAAVVGSVSAGTTFDVLVGDGGLKFNPPFVNAVAGDTVNFAFVAKNHSVTQSTFKNPCTFNGTIDSGFRPSNNVTGLIPANFTVAVNNTNPVWFYCAQTNGTNHCQAGMVFAINPGNGVLATGNTTLAQYQINANMSGTSNSTGTNSTSNSTGTSSSPAPSHSSGAGSVARNTAGVLAVVGAAFGLLL